MVARLMWCVILAMISQPLLGQRWVPEGSNAGSGAVTAFVSDDQPPGPVMAGPENASVVPVPSADATLEEISPATDYFGPVVGAYTGSPGWSPCLFFATVDAIFLDRDNRSYNRSLAIDTDSGNTLLSTGGLNFDYEPGVRATIGLVRPPCCWCSAWELTYLGIYDWDASSSVHGEDNLSVPGDLGFVVNGFTLAEAIRSEYSSKIQSAEANCIRCIHQHCCCCCYRRVDWIAGFRYLKLDEDLVLLGNNEDVAAAVYDVDTDNNLYGAQIGARMRSFRPMQRCCGYWGWELQGKAGVFANDASQRQHIVDELGVNDFVQRSASASKDDLAFVGDLGLSLLLRMSSVCGLRCGYNLLWVEGVALAPDQLDFSDTRHSGTYLRSGAGAFLHGFNVGLEVGW